MISVLVLAVAAATPAPTPTRTVTPTTTQIPTSAGKAERAPEVSQGGIAALAKRPGLRMPSADPGQDNPKLIRIVSPKPQGQVEAAPVSAPGLVTPLTEAQGKLVDRIRAEMAAIKKEAADKRDTYELAVQSACSGTTLVEDGWYQDDPGQSPRRKYRVEDKAYSYECRDATRRSEEFWGGLAARTEAAKSALGQAGLPSDLWYSLSHEFGFL